MTSSARRLTIGFIMGRNDSRYTLHPQFIDDPGLRNDAKLKPIQLPLCQTLAASSTGEKPTWACCSWRGHLASVDVFNPLCADGVYGSPVGRSGEPLSVQPGGAAQTRAAVRGGAAAGPQPVGQRGALLHAAARQYAGQRFCTEGPVLLRESGQERRQAAGTSTSTREPPRCIPLAPRPVRGSFTPQCAAYQLLTFSIQAQC